jgi:hypothetical protein
VAGNLHDRSDAPGKAGRMPQGQFGTVACVGTAKPPRFADRPQIASRKSLTTRREFQRSGGKCNCKRFATSYISFESTMFF